MRGWLIDTNVVSELRRARPAQKVRAFVAGQPGDVIFTSDVIVAEVRCGIEQITDPARRADLGQWLDRTLRPLFAGRVLAVTGDALLLWRPMLEVGRNKGRTFSEPDLLIAALAALADLIVVSRDESELIAAGAPVFDPWDWTLHAGGRARQIADADMADALAKATGADRKLTRGASKVLSPLHSRIRGCGIPLAAPAPCGPTCRRRASISLCKVLVAAWTVPLRTRSMRAARVGREGSLGSHGKVPTVAGRKSSPQTVQRALQNFGDHGLGAKSSVK